MAKKVELIENNAGGIDLLTERDGGNEVRILTGKKESSIKFWKALIEASTNALIELGVEVNTKNIKKKFTLFWLDGKREVVEGYDIANAINSAGYGQGAMRALDFHAEGDCNEYAWDAGAKAWEKVNESNHE